MLKVKLIEDQNYYKLFSWQLLFSIIPTFPIVIILRYFDYSILSMIISGLFFLIIILWLNKNVKKINSFSRKKTLEIGDDGLRITSNDITSDKQVKFDNNSKIYVKKEYGIPGDSIMDLKKEFVGDHRMNYIVVENNNEKQRFDFIVDSYYTLTQINKLINTWKNKGYHIETI